MGKRKGQINKLDWESPVYCMNRKRFTTVQQALNGRWKTFAVCSMKYMVKRMLEYID